MLHETLGGSIGVVLVCIVILMLSAERAVQKIIGILNKYKFSSTFGGLTIFSLATSIPEIFAHLAASFGILRGTLDYKIASATVLGANIGSDVIQQTLLIGLVVLLMGGLTFERKFLKTAYLPMIGTTLMCIILGWDRTFSRLDGAILFGTFLAYMFFLYRLELNHHVEIKGPKSTRPLLDALIATSFMAIMLISAHFLLKTTEHIVTLTGLGGSLIGVISLGVASAAPELFTALSGIKQKAMGISLGTLIGSNITNPLVAIGGGALLSTYWVPLPLIYWDLPMETITAALLLIYLLRNKGKLGKGGAYYLIGLYAVYLIMRFAFFSVD
ncbi:sodium:calcium antiporter [Candidatus Woesearchaeota archaeon]|nr:MAG: sodium:calcium antiporter [Candidatus Woesearchaeota archaeon]